MTALCWLFDGATQLYGCHRTDIFLVLGKRLTEQVKTGAVGVKIGTQNNNDDCNPIRLNCRSEQVFDKGGLFCLTPAKGKQFFELVDDQQCMVSAGVFCYAFKS